MNRGACNRGSQNAIAPPKPLLALHFLDQDGVRCRVKCAGVL